MKAIIIALLLFNFIRCSGSPPDTTQKKQIAIEILTGDSIRIWGLEGFEYQNEDCNGGEKINFKNDSTLTFFNCDSSNWTASKKKWYISHDEVDLLLKIDNTLFQLILLQKDSLDHYRFRLKEISDIVKPEKNFITL